eukprot:XP_011617584.1 PREDICTED: uncharacterized protein LOC105418762 isoform X1 [Takifugu rubripes]
MALDQMCVCCLFSVVLLWSPSLGEDTGEINAASRSTSLHQNCTSSLGFVCRGCLVAEDIGAHQLERLVELLTPKECEDLLVALSHPEENIFQHIERLSPEKNQLNLKQRAKRDTPAPVDTDVECHTALSDWLLHYGEQIYYDRLSRALQHIGRTDIALEVGKNINQDKSLKIKRFVEDYHKYVSSLKIPSSAKERQQEAPMTHKKRKVRDLTWRELDLIIERPPLRPYQKGPLDWARMLLFGALIGFIVTLLLAISTILVIRQTLGWALFL